MLDLLHVSLAVGRQFSLKLIFLWMHFSADVCEWFLWDNLQREIWERKKLERVLRKFLTIGKLIELN